MVTTSLPLPRIVVYFGRALSETFRFTAEELPYWDAQVADDEEAEAWEELPVREPVLPEFP